MNDENKDQLNAEENESLAVDQMSDGLLPGQADDKVDAQEPVADESLEKAKKYGYKTKEQWVQEGRDPNKYKSPDEFLKFGETYDIVKSLKTELSHIRQELAETKKRKAEEAVRQARIELEKQLHQAKLTGDINTVEQLAQQRAQIEVQHQQQVAADAMQEQAKINMQFVERNKHWYNDSRPDLQEEAKVRANRILSEVPNISYAAAAMQVENEMKWAHPEINVPVAVPRTDTSPSRSNVNKTMMDSNPGKYDETRLLKSLTPDQVAEFNAVKAVVEGLNERHPNPRHKTTYTVKEYLDFANKK